MLLNTTSLFSQVFVSYTTYVFGHDIFTCLMIFLLFFIIGSMVKIPLALNLALFIPLSIVLMAMGLLPVVAGASFVAILMVLTGISLVNSL